MNQNINCHGFTVNGSNIQAQFNRAAERYVARWQCKPPMLWHNEATQLPEELGGLETAVDNQIPRNAWYFEVPEKKLTRR